MLANINDVVTQLEKMFIELNTKGMEGKFGIVWPVIIKKSRFGVSCEYEYEYPEAFFTNIQLQQKIIIPYGITKSKLNRLTLVKLIIDKHMNGEIDIFCYHFGMFLIYRGHLCCGAWDKDFSDASIGKKRSQFVQTLPVSRFMSADDFITATWVHQVESSDTDAGEFRRNPFLRNVRVLFTNEQFASCTGIHYPDDVTWVEPISGKLDLECRKWSEEKDPMAPNEIPEGWVQGEIILCNEGVNGLRHYVNGVPVHAGSAIQVKFGNGWISGRYEWRFAGKSKIQVHCNDDVLYIDEGHQVRVRNLDWLKKVSGGEG